MGDIIKATPEEAGLYVDGCWGQYGGARMIMRAVEYGYSDSEAIDLAMRHLDSMYPSDGPWLSDDEHAELSDAVDDAEGWLNENVAPEGFYFGWHEGEFFLQSAEWWDEETY